MNPRFQTFVYGTAIALMLGWLFYIGRDVFVPIMFSVFVVYVILGLMRMIGRLPLLGPVLPQLVVSLLSVLVIALGLGMVVYTIVSNRDSVIAMAPRYQESLLAAVQKLAVMLRLEAEPTWTTLRRDLFAQVSLQRLAASALASVSSLAASVMVVALYACFLLLERSRLDVKIAAIASSPQHAQRIKQVITDINARVGAYLALKTFLGVLLGVLSWVIMKFAGLEFAVFWAVIIALLNYVPYIGSFLSIVLPGLMAVAQFGGGGEAIQIMLSLTVVQFLIGNFLDPYIMGNSLNLSPFAILVSLAVWVALWGVPGAFLAVPITAMMTIIFSEFSGTRPIAVLLSQNGKP
ncbi:AI-2E family transporter [Variovorax sp. J22P168]|uniref:AI-2E family transporter n=1 Tax=Variovorax jilinensis TaxID=3053513 RepID=UPI0025779982|nr:AI-2E family transporter [Variovorax sp. J22P168]MDM0011305.1 AI-2E family transporter [Variovorax sp. J22P168]